MAAKRIKPNQSFSMEQDGFFGEYYKAKDNAFPHRFESHIYPHLGHFILPVRPYSSALFISERKYKKECAKERKQSWEDTLAFLRAW